MMMSDLNKKSKRRKKRSQNRYAQLVDAQSPEPSDTNPEQLDEDSSNKAQDEQEKQQQQQQDLSILNDDKNEPTTSVSTTDQQQVELAQGESSEIDKLLNSSQANETLLVSPQVSSMVVPLRSSPSKQHEEATTDNKIHQLRPQSQQILSLNLSTSVDSQQTFAESPSSGRGSNLTRTVSRSLLDLDGLARLERFEVSWRNLSYSYQQGWLGSLTSKKPTQVLNDVSGKFTSNQLVAIIGPSGCGKTTLLQFLSGNNEAHKRSVKICGLDEPKVAFIGQGDSLLPGLTARETLVYASRLQNCKRNFDHQEHVNRIIKELGLSECADRTVTKLSGGQVKRVTIAQELLYPTNLLILDEVTSGLDASTSFSIVKLLKQLVSDYEYPMSIVMSIHQPSARLFNVFDQVYVMSEGCCLYEGSCNVEAINAHLTRFGQLECPKFNNIADFLIEIACDYDFDDEKRLLREQMIEFERKRSHMQDSVAPRETTFNHQGRLEGVRIELDSFGRNEESGVKLSMLMESSLYDAVESARNKKDNFFLTDLSVHLSRSFLRIRRSLILTYLQFITYILLGLQLSTFYGPDIGTLSGCPKLPLSFVGFVFASDSDLDTLSTEMRRIQENMNFLLVAVMTATFAALEITVITFPMEAKTVKREWRNGWYRVSSYFMGRTLADLPFQLIFVIAFCTVIYTITNQAGFTSWRFGVFVLILVMTALVAQTVGFIFGAMFMNNLPAAVFTAPLCIFPALLFSGFFSRVSQIPSFYKPMTYLSHFRYAFDALLVTLYGYGRCQCDQETLDTYHEGLNNQTSSIKTLFHSLFGSSDCLNANSAINSAENSIEDNPLTDSTNFVIQNFTSTTTSLPYSLKPIEDALVDSVFNQMNSTSNSSDVDAIDKLTGRFSTRITSMLNSQANFGHQVPKECSRFNSYLMNEFNLHDDDLITGLALLFVVVITTRLLCGFILSHTIAQRG